MTLYRLMIVAVLSSTSSSAPAQWRGMQKQDILASADANGDGFVTREEYARSRDAQFTKMDRNGDGVVTRLDFGRLARFKPDAVDRIMASLQPADVDRDGRITRSEMTAAPLSIFTIGDTDHDGRLSQSEVAALRARRAER